MVAYHQKLLAPEQRWQRPDVGLGSFVHDDQVKQADLGRNGLRHAPLRQHPTWDSFVGPNHRVSSVFAMAYSAHASTGPHGLNRVQVGLQSLAHAVRRVVVNTQPGFFGHQLLIGLCQGVGELPTLFKQLTHLVVAIDAVQKIDRQAPVPGVFPVERHQRVEFALGLFCSGALRPLRSACQLQKVRDLFNDFDVRPQLLQSLQLRHGRKPSCLQDTFIRVGAAQRPHQDVTNFTDDSARMSVQLLNDFLHTSKRVTQTAFVQVRLKALADQPDESFTLVPKFGCRCVAKDRRHL